MSWAKESEMDRTLTAVLCQTHDRKPLAHIDGLPGGGADLRPEELRALAAALLRIADAAESRPMGARTYRREKREYVVATEDKEGR